VKFKSKIYHTKSSRATKERLEMGYDSYEAQGCVACHELNPIGAIGSTGPTNNKMATIAAQRIKEASYTGNATNAADYIRESIIEPAAYLVEDYSNVMPLYGIPQNRTAVNGRCWADLDFMAAYPKTNWRCWWRSCCRNKMRDA